MIRCSLMIFMMILAVMPALASAEYRERLLAVIPAGTELETAKIVFSPDGSKAAFSVRSGNQFRVVFGDNVSKLYGQIRHLAISADGRYAAHNGMPYLQQEGNRQEYLVVNGLETGPYNSVCNPTVTPDSSTVVFEAEYGGKWRFAVSAAGFAGIKAETAVADMHFMPPVVSPDSRFVVSIQDQLEAGKYVRLVSTLEMRAVRSRVYDDISQIVYSLDRLRTAYVAKRKGKRFAVTSSFAGGDEHEGVPFDSIYGLGLSADGAHLAYGALRGEKHFHVVDELEHPAAFYYDGLPVFSRDGKTVAYRAMVDGKSFIAAKGKMISGYDDVSNPVLSSNGTILAFIGKKQGLGRVNVNGKESPAYEHIDTLQFTPDDRYLTFRATKADFYRMVIIDLEGKVVTEGSLFKEIWTPSFDETGRLGYGALHEREIWWKVLTL